MDGISLYDDCVMLAYNKEVRRNCLPFTCGENDLDDFFLNDADLYADELLGKTYCWVTTEIPHRIVALFTLSNDSIKTRLISPNDKNRLQRNIVNPNTGKIIDYLDESFMHANCGDCKEEVVITDVDRVKKDIDSMFFEFVKKNGEEPEYVECQIVWKDTGDDQRTTIKLSLSINDDDNDNVFYYCNGIESLKSLVEYGVGEFIVIDCWSFFSIDNL